MQQLNRTNAATTTAYPEVVLQFGGGNFLRAFSDWIIDIYNEKKGTRLGILVATTTQRQGYQDWNEQDGLYHLMLKGISEGKTVDETRLIKSVSRVIAMEPEWEAFLQTAENPVTRYIISNTTEAGIRFNEADQLSADPPSEFPAKLTRWLYHRYQHFNGDPAAGCVFFPVELIDNNGAALKKCLLEYCVHWGLEPGFADWLHSANQYCNSLVDRIVPGIGREKLPAAWESFGFEDKAATQGEPYHLWAIEAPAAVQQELPLDDLGLNIIFTEDLAPYRLSKVRVLNGAHTAMVPVGLLAGLESVGEAIEDNTVGAFIKQAVFNEIIPTLDLPELDLNSYAEAILDRFRNPSIHHRLISISLNSVAKFRERVLPSLLAYAKTKKELPPALCLAFAALIQFYRGNFKGQEFPLNDQPWATEFFQEAWQKCDGSPETISLMVTKVLQWERAWNRSLLNIEGLQEEITAQLLRLNSEGMAAALRYVLAHNGERQND